MSAPSSRESYEGGGWKDGRLGQAYDLLAEVLDERGELRFNHPMLIEIEKLDEANLSGLVRWACYRCSLHQ